jgi:hypothetical protein
MVIPKTERPNARPPRLSPPSATTEPVKLGRDIQVQSESKADSGLSMLASFPQRSPTRLSVFAKFGLVFLLALAIGGVVFSAATNHLSAPAAPVIAQAVQAVEVGPSLAIGLAGWIPDFAPAGGSQKGRRVSILRGSKQLTDFRLEFPGQIVGKALGWVIRAKDPQNFYVMKLEIVKPIPDSRGVLTRFAVIHGQEQLREQVPLPLPLRPNTVYRIRVDAIGSRFTTWVQGEKVDQWVDPRIQEGAVGLYTESGDRGTLDGEMSVFALLAKSQSKR